MRFGTLVRTLTTLEQQDVDAQVRSAFPWKWIQKNVRSSLGDDEVRSLIRARIGAFQPKGTASVPPRPDRQRVIDDPHAALVEYLQWVADEVQRADYYFGGIANGGQGSAGQAFPLVGQDLRTLVRRAAARPAGVRPEQPGVVGAQRKLARLATHLKQYVEDERRGREAE
jgi:hypothetical protein